MKCGGLFRCETHRFFVVKRSGLFRCETHRFSFVVWRERPTNGIFHRVRIIWSHFAKKNVTGYGSGVTVSFIGTLFAFLVSFQGFGRIFHES